MTSFDYRKRLENEFKDYATKHGISETPANVIAWYEDKIISREKDWARSILKRNEREMDIIRGSLRKNTEKRYEKLKNINDFLKETIPLSEKDLELIQE